MIAEERGQGPADCAPSGRPLFRDAAYIVDDELSDEPWRGEQ